MPDNLASTECAAVELALLAKKLRSLRVHNIAIHAALHNRLEDSCLLRWRLQDDFLGAAIDVEDSSHFREHPLVKIVMLQVVFSKPSLCSPCPLWLSDAEHDHLIARFF